MLSYLIFVGTMQRGRVTMSLHKSDGNEWIQHNTNAIQKKTSNTTHHNTTQQNRTQQNTTEHKKLISNVTTFLQDRMTNELFKLKTNVMYSDMHAKVAQFNHDMMWKQKN